MKSKSHPQHRVITVARPASVDPDYLPLRATAAACGISTSTLKRLVELDGTFPPPVRLSSKIILFDRAAVRDWFQRRAVTDAAAAKQSNGLPIPAIRDLRGAVKKLRDATSPKPVTGRRSASAVRGSAS
jgi:predicted DNA-binding transcriptional regulator AlpA